MEGSNEEGDRGPSRSSRTLWSVPLLGWDSFVAFRARLDQSVGTKGRAPGRSPEERRGGAASSADRSRLPMGSADPGVVSRASLAPPDSGANGSGSECFLESLSAHSEEFSGARFCSRFFLNWR